MSKKADESKSESEDEQLSVVRVDRNFEYRGAQFEAGKYYRLKDEPEGFLTNRLDKRENGKVVDEKDVPSGTEILDDPRPAAEAAAEREPYIRQEPRQEVERPLPVAGAASTFTGTENVFGGTHTPEGSGPGQPLGADPRKKADSVAGAAGDDSTSGAADDGTAASKSKRPASIRT
jgi:hypothetical protein